MTPRRDDGSPPVPSGTRNCRTAVKIAASMGAAVTVVAGVLVVLMLAGPGLGVAAADPLAALNHAPIPVAGQMWVPGRVLAQAQSVDAVLINVRNWIMGIAAGLATVFITVGAVRYMAAGGDLGEVEKAKTAFRSAAFGYALALLTPLVLTALREIVGVGG